MDDNQRLLKTGWEQVLCSPASDRGAKWSHETGHYSNNVNLDKFVQGLLLFGPTSVLLLLAPLRIYQLYGSKIKLLPNYRWLLKAVSRLQYHDTPN